eukprot:Gb_29556 [translate_table: standard]
MQMLIQVGFDSVLKNSCFPYFLATWGERKASKSVDKRRRDPATPCPRSENPSLTNKGRKGIHDVNTKGWNKLCRAKKRLQRVAIKEEEVLGEKVCPCSTKGIQEEGEHFVEKGHSANRGEDCDFTEQFSYESIFLVPGNNLSLPRTVSNKSGYVGCISAHDRLDLPPTRVVCSYFVESLQDYQQLCSRHQILIPTDYHQQGHDQSEFYLQQDKFFLVYVHLKADFSIYLSPLELPGSGPGGPISISNPFQIQIQPRNGSGNTQCYLRPRFCTNYSDSFKFTVVDTSPVSQGEKPERIQENRTLPAEDDSERPQNVSVETEDKDNLGSHPHVHLFVFPMNSDQVDAVDGSMIGSSDTKEQGSMLFDYMEGTPEAFSDSSLSEINISIPSPIQASSEKRIRSTLLSRDWLSGNSSSNSSQYSGLCTLTPSAGLGWSLPQEQPESALVNPIPSTGTELLEVSKSEDNSQLENSHPEEDSEHPQQEPTHSELRIKGGKNTSNPYSPRTRSVSRLIQDDASCSLNTCTSESNGITILDTNMESWEGDSNSDAQPGAKSRVQEEETNLNSEESPQEGFYPESFRQEKWKINLHVAGFEEIQEITILPKVIT